MGSKVPPITPSRRRRAVRRGHRAGLSGACCELPRKVQTQAEQRDERPRSAITPYIVGGSGSSRVVLGRRWPPGPGPATSWAPSFCAGLRPGATVGGGLVRVQSDRSLDRPRRSSHRRARAVRRRPRLRRGRGAAAVRRAAAPRARRHRRDATRCWSSTTAARTPRPVLLERMRRDWPAAARRPAAGQRGHQAALSAGLARARGRLGGQHRRRPAGPARDASPRCCRRRRPQGVDVVYGVRTDRSTDSVFKRGTARRVLPGDAAARAAAAARARRRLPADEPGHRRRGQRAARAPPGAAAGRAGAGLPQRRGGLPARGPGRRADEVPVHQDAAAQRRQPHRLLHRAAAAGHLVRAGRRRSPRSRCWSTRSVVVPRPGTPSPGWTSTFVAVAAVGAVQLLCLGMLGEYVGRLYTQMQGRPSYFVAYDSAARGDASPLRDVGPRPAARRRAASAPAGSARR